MSGTNRLRHEVSLIHIKTSFKPGRLVVPGGLYYYPIFFWLSESIMRIHMNQVYTMKGWQSGLTPRPCAARDDRGFWTLHRCIWHCKCTVYRMTVAVVWRCARAVYLATCTKNIWGCPKSYEVAQVLIQVVALGIDLFKGLWGTHIVGTPPKRIVVVILRKSCAPRLRQSSWNPLPIQSDEG